MARKWQVCLSMIVLAGGLLAFTGSAQAAVGEKINNYSVIARIQSDARVRVTETIEYNFGTNVSHGIFRDIDNVKVNDEGKRFRLIINGLTVEDQNGQSIPYTRSDSGDFVKLKIGDPDRTVSGVQTYVISYLVSGAITYFSEHDEFYWNVVGFGHDMSIVSADITVVLPAGVASTATCYTGVEGSTARSCASVIVNEQTRFSTKGWLEAYEGFTIVLGFAPGIVEYLEPLAITGFVDTLIGKVVILGIALLAFFWYVIYPIKIMLNWYASGRDPKGGREVTAWFEPPQHKNGRPMLPGEVGTVVDETASLQEVSATLVHLAQRGYLKIADRGKEGFFLVKQKEFKEDKELVKFESMLLAGLFKTNTELGVKNAKLVGTVGAVQNELHAALTKDGYFNRDPKKVRTFYTGVGVGALMTFNLFLTLVAFGYGRQMARKTKIGVEAAAVGRSLKRFLSSQERQLEFQADAQMMFEKLLPYAIAFGVEKIWAKRFKDLALTPPDWYEGDNANLLSTVMITSALNNSLTSFRSAATPTSSSSGFSSGFSGGGFSGGGGGGGRVGSW